MESKKLQSTLDNETPGSTMNPYERDPGYRGWPQFYKKRINPLVLCQ